MRGGFTTLRLRSGQATPGEHGGYESFNSSPCPQCLRGEESLPEQLLDLWLDGRRRCHRRETLYDVSLLVHQELGEVPLDAIAQQAALFALQKLEDRMRVVAVDLDLGEQWEVHSVIDLAERFDLVIGARLLMAELVAGKAEHLQAAVFVLGVKRLQTFVLRREPALAGGVDDQQDLSLVITKFFVSAIVEFCGKIVQAHLKLLAVSS